MNPRSIRKFLLPPGPVLSLTLIGVLLLSAVLYYRAIKIQRFLEPALALSQPRMEFADNISRLLRKEFGARQVRGIIFTTDSILVDSSFLSDTGRMKTVAPMVFKKLSSIFLDLLKDEKMRGYIDVILISTKSPLTSDGNRNRELRLKMQHTSEKILHSIYDAEPELEAVYSTYFAATAMSVVPDAKYAGWVEFKIVPSEQLHIDVLQRLEKYAF